MKKGIIAALLIAAGAVLAHMHVVAQTYYPVVHVTTAAVLLLSGTLATVVPALRASSVDPLTALRRE